MTRSRLLAAGVGAGMGLLLWSGTACAALQNAAAAEETARATAASTEEALPTADEVIARGVEAMGGREAFEKIKTIRMRLDVKLREQSSPMQVAYTHPDLLYVLSEVQRGTGPLEMGRNGDVHWLRIPPLPAKSVPGQNLAHITSIARLYRLVLDLPERFETRETLDRVVYLEQDCYRLKLVPKPDPKQEKPAPETIAYFAVESGRLVAMETPTKYLKSGRATTVYSQWKRFGKFNLFTKIRTDDRGVPMTRTILALTFNDVPETAYALPPEVREEVMQGPQLGPVEIVPEKSEEAKQDPPTSRENDDS